MNDAMLKDYTVVDDKVYKIVEGIAKILILRDLGWPVANIFHDDNNYPGQARIFESVKATCYSQI